ncbi:hypothetical protein [Streptomyces sp900116325]|uniref:Uncharacterized protein n=1 Tax=Streptomyces sp. 900116325 TaxID=3154295 RepID=A0ABV2ULP5_9ACTN
MVGFVDFQEQRFSMGQLVIIWFGLSSRNDGAAVGAVKKREGGNRRGVGRMSELDT